MNWLKGKKLRFLYLYNRAEKQYCKEIAFQINKKMEAFLADGYFTVSFMESLMR